ncbi:ribonuclease P protein subunit p38 [Nothobranchius furzeri]|uniref:Ribonuclease P/MRP 38 subunit n=1 Tax=Nothobranchius furzeri TaxID=105023 RepID=A0A1A8A1P6_NOTFU|nr:transcript variant X1 [Nothobranchius furzeri]KAF7227324.1 transcript variant X2 [Nothobranchius furzeri]
MATKEKSAKKARKHVPAKTSFTSPLSVGWSSLPQGHAHFILKTTKDKLISTGLMKKEVKVLRPRKKREKGGSLSKAEPAPQVSQVGDPIRNGWTDVAARRQLAIGINEVTKALERNELQLLLVCKSAKPQHMMNHLIALSVTRGAPACQVPRLSETVSGPLGLKSVLALGFRRSSSEDNQVFTDVIDAIKPKVPPLDVAWLQNASSRGTPEHPAGQEDGPRGQKRKLESESEKHTESPPSPCSLQPLKVKRIIANPAKRRKQKPKKKPVK